MIIFGLKEEEEEKKRNLQRVSLLRKCPQRRTEQYCKRKPKSWGNMSYYCYSPSIESRCGLEVACGAVAWGAKEKEHCVSSTTPVCGSLFYCVVTNLVSSHQRGPTSVWALLSPFLK